MKKNLLKIRAHHFLCMQGFQGYGYSTDFVNHMTEIIALIKANPNSKIMLINYCDAICMACNNNLNNKCKDFDKINRMDNLVLEILGLKNEQLILPYDAFELVNEKMLTVESANKVCGTCSWQTKCLWFLKRI